MEQIVIPRFQVGNLDRPRALVALVESQEDPRGLSLVGRSGGLVNGGTALVPPPLPLVPVN
jgi:hypothetical protein